jgi:segregation and condensation protein A
MPWLMEAEDPEEARPELPLSEPTLMDEPAPALSVQSPGQSKRDDGYQVRLPMFEGPLDLLLHLVKKHELDILDIPIAFITEKYTAYIRLLDELNIDVASEYLLMAATLVHIKSRMLLPNPPADDSEDNADDADFDPRAELVRRLLQYQKYKLAAEELSQRSLLGRDVFPRGTSDEVAAGQPPLETVNVFKLLDAFQAVLERTHQSRDHEIDFDRFSITEKISELSDLLQRVKKLVFHEMFPERSSRAELIMTFLAILEMTRLRMTRLTQDGPLSPIYIELRVAEDGTAEDGTAAEGLIDDGVTDAAEYAAAQEDIDEDGMAGSSTLDGEGADPVASEDDQEYD